MNVECISLVKKISKKAIRQNKTDQAFKNIDMFRQFRGEQ